MKVSFKPFPFSIHCNTYSPYDYVAFRYSADILQFSSLYIDDVHRNDDMNIQEIETGRNANYDFQNCIKIFLKGFRFLPHGLEESMNIILIFNNQLKLCASFFLNCKNNFMRLTIAAGKFLIH